VVANRLVYRFRGPRRCGAGSTLVKRVIGLSGEPVVEHPGAVSIDGRALNEPYLDLFHRDRGTVLPRRPAVGEGPTSSALSASSRE